MTTGFRVRIPLSSINLAGRPLSPKDNEVTAE
jgi:hypothetical protein